jgi:pyruvate/2-oxoglutarate dehydrogenase complex dihydrolipoamide acyltransferase (E2) component
MKTLGPMKIVSIYCPDYQFPQYNYLVTAWFVETGEYLCAGDFLCEITTANVSVTIHAPCSGHLLQKFRNINELSAPGEELCQITSTD